jgi:hypothetical protein
MADVQIQAGNLFANAEERIVSGLLLPYGEQGKTNLGRFSVAPGAVTIPADPDIVTLNVQHDREEPVGRAVDLSDTPAGIVGTFRVANTPEGDTVLAEIADGSRTKLSAEVKNVVIRSGKAVGGMLFGAAIVEEGAFPSAALLAEIAPDTEPEKEDAEVEETTLKAEILDIVEDVEGDNIKIEVGSPEEVPDMVLVTVTDPETNEVSQTTFVEETQTEEEEGETPMGAATAPETLQAHKAAPANEGINTVMAQLSSAAKSGSRSLFAEVMKRDDAKAVTSLFAALDDVKFDSAGSVGINTAQPQWLGELWTGRTYERKFIPLISSGQMTALTMQAWRWTTKPTVEVWTGNKSAVPSNTPATESFEVTGVRYAGAHDYAREFVDFGRNDVIESALRGMVESYAKITDEATLTALLGGAKEIEAGTATTQVAWNRIMDGVEEILPYAIPTFAIVAKDLYRELLLTTSNDALAYLNASLGLESGTGVGFSIVPSATMDAGTVLVGAREAATSFELGGSPIRAEATDMVLGGFDIGLFGYHAAAVTNENAIALVAPAA